MTSNTTEEVNPTPVKPYDTWVGWISILLILIALSSVTKVFLDARNELAIGEQFLSEGNLPRATDHFERAIRWHLPALGVADEAATNLWTIADKYESKGFSQPALDTYRILRSAFYSTRSFFTPGTDWIEKCNDKIATLMARMPAPAPVDENKSFETRRDEYLALLEQDRSPHTGWAIVAEAGFFGWVGCLIGLIVQGFNREGKMKRRPVVLWSLAFTLFFAVWGFGLMGV